MCFDGSSGLHAIQTATFDLLVLDVMLPTVDGFQLTRRARLAGVQAPILFLTGRDAPEDIVRGLDAGADDYVTKPFSLVVLLARVPHGCGRRMRADPVLWVRRPDHRFRRANSRACWHEVKLTRTEFSILECLAKSARRIVTRDRLLDTVWGDREVGGNNLEVFISFLRNKIDGPGHRKLIQTVRGVGYSLREEL